MNPRMLIGLCLAACVLCLLPIEALAGPGGEIIEVAFKSKIGRIVMIVLAIIFLPLILFAVIGERRGISRTKKDLATLANEFPQFDWKPIENRIKDMATRFYTQWNSGNIHGMKGMLTPPYLVSQQEILDRWADEGKHNHCELKKISSVKPLMVSVADAFGPSLLKVKLTLNVMDYMTGENDKLIQGKKEVNDGFETIWNLVHEAGEWQLMSIEDGDESLNIALEKNFTDTEWLTSGPHAGPTRVAARGADAPEEAPVESEPAARPEEQPDSQG